MDINFKESKILLVDDTPTNLDVLRTMLEREGYSIGVAPDGETALKIAERFQPDLILLDVMMPGIDGYETCRRFKQMEALKSVPVIFITAKDLAEDIVEGLDSGGVDYMSKPFHYREVCARVRTHLRLNQLLKERDKLISDLIRANKKLDSAARTDPLTQLSNRRDLWEKLEEEFVRFQRSKKAFSIIMGDIDHFKRFNDEHGHDAGDFVLVQVAKILMANCRDQDKPGRWGGEEFLIFLPETGLTGAATLAEKMRKEIESHSFQFNELNFKVTISFGVNTFAEGQAMDRCLKIADECLYEAKKQGRNCVVSAHE